MACYGSNTGPSVDKDVWRGITAVATSGDTVTTTALLHLHNQQELYAYGSTLGAFESPGGLHGFAMPDASTYVVGLFDDDTKVAVMNLASCDFIPGGAATRHMALYSDEQSFLTAGSLGIPPPDDTTTTWAPGVGQTDGCGSADQVNTNAGGDKAGDVPFAEFTDLGTSVQLIPVGSSDGVVFDALFSDPQIALFGAAKGDIFDAPVALAPTYFIQIGDDNNSVVTKLVPSVFVDTNQAHVSWSGAAAFDDAHNVWFGGSTCDAAGGCSDAHAFLGHFALTDTQPQLVTDKVGGPSAVTSVRFSNGSLLVGGRYEGSPTLLDAVLPDASTSTVPFVLSLDPVTHLTQWSYPSADSPMAVDPTVWRSVVDVATLGPRDCGAVYVAGCVVPTGSAVLDCATMSAGKRGFLTKLDSATGHLVWTREITLGAPATDLFVPTAITAAEDHVWVAATFFGSADAWGTPLTSGVSNESAVLRIAP